ncbi:MAG: hypothetical protein IPJ65_10725 [Archangiaceae bacterium]|nr:hypothetical protein [Archangiaceae bacterium]
MRISAGYRFALAAKGLLLFCMAAVFGALVARGAFAADRALLLRPLALVVFGVPLVFLGWTSLLAFADALVGAAVEVDGAVALQPRRRRWGTSFRLPNGRAAEFVLYNPYPPLVPDAKYGVTIGRYSRVLVQAPRPQP